MVTIEKVRKDNDESLGQAEDLTTVFVAGTSGLGEYALCRLATLRGRLDKGLYVYLVGRSEEKAQATIQKCTSYCPKAKFHFVQVSDVSLLRNVDQACQEIIKQEDQRKEKKVPSIDILLMTQGKIEVGPRIDTKEGLDKSMSLLYYSRLRFIVSLSTLLEASSFGGKVVSVYAAGMEKDFYPEDLSLRHHYTFANCRTQVVHMKTLAFEHLAQQYRGKISFVHYFPSIVVTPGYYDSTLPWWFRMIWKVLGPAVKRFLSVPADESGDRIIYLATDQYASTTNDNHKNENLVISTDGIKGGGAYAVTWNNELISQSHLKNKYEHLRSKEYGKKIWNHTNAAFDTIINQERVFEE